MEKHRCGRFRSGNHHFPDRSFVPSRLRGKFVLRDFDQIVETMRSTTSSGVSLVTSISPLIIDRQIGSRLASMASISSTLPLFPALGTELNWRGNPNLAMPAIVLASLWVSIGYTMIYWLAALQAVDH